MPAFQLSRFIVAFRTAARVNVIAISVIICSHNPSADYLDRVLDSLRVQSLPREQWELLLVDNASAEPVVKRWDLNWHPAARHMREDELGLASARLRGITEARGGVLVFVDDDNVLAPNFLAEAHRIGHEWPMLGVWGGSIIPEYEMEPPSHLREYLRGVAYVEVKSPRWSNVIGSPGVWVNGGGMCLRAEVATAYRQFYDNSDIRLTGRSGHDLISGEDSEICHVACDLGYGVGLFPELQLTHVIPRWRTGEQYLVRLIEGIQTSLMLIEFKWNGILPRAPYSGIELLRLLKNVSIRRGIDRRMYLARRRAIRRARTMIREALQSRTGSN